MIGTADFTHPKWFSEIKERLEEAEPGLFKLRGRVSTARFMLTTEVAQIYRRGDRVRRIHNILFAPSIVSVERIIAELEQRGFNLASDGRPILGLDSEELLKILLTIDERIILIPAHVWTPWFSVFGSKSGFNALEECFGEMTPYIYAIETGLSSDPAMNRRLSALDRLFLISNSDAHSPRNFGREANIFEIPSDLMTYNEFLRIFRERDTSRFISTIEFFPEEGKYHFDGHADCDFFCSPEETKKIGGRCPHCGKNLTIGVMNRVLELADRHLFPRGQILDTSYHSIVPLETIIAESVGLSSTSSKKVQTLYDELILKLGNEFSILLDVPLEEIAKINSTVSEAVRRVRAGQLQIRPGYDGIYGRVKIFTSEDAARRPKQGVLL